MAARSAGEYAKVAALRKVLAEEPVGVLVGASLPGPTGIREEHSVGEEVGDLVVAGHLRSLIPGEAAAGTRREIGHGLGQGVPQLVGARPSGR